MASTPRPLTTPSSRSDKAGDRRCIDLQVHVRSRLGIQALRDRASANGRNGRSALCFGLREFRCGQDELRVTGKPLHGEVDERSCVGSVHEGFPYALEINKKGYNAFVLAYRSGHSPQANPRAGASRVFQHNRPIAALPALRRISDRTCVSQRTLAGTPKARLGSSRYRRDLHPGQGECK
jgi:hypothetical protein